MAVINYKIMLKNRLLIMVIMLYLSQMFNLNLNTILKIQLHNFGIITQFIVYTYKKKEY